MAGRSCLMRDFKHVYNVTVSDYTVLVTVTNHPDAITEWINGVNADGHTVVRKVGFEIELNNNSSPVGTVQLCVGRRCLVIQLAPRLSPFHRALNEFLCNSKNTFMGFQIADKVNTLRKQVPIRVEQMRTMDLIKDVPQLLKNKPKVFAAYGLHPDTIETDWGRTRMLSDKQVQYACIDALLNLHAAFGSARSRTNKRAARS